MDNEKREQYAQDLLSKMSKSKDDIEHHGVKGMKWGVRNARLKGTSDIAKSGSEAARTISNMTKKSKKAAKEAKEMSNEELQARIRRMDLERRYSELNPSKVSKGAEKAANIMSIIGNLAAIGASIATVVLAVEGHRNKGKGGTP